MAVQLQQAIAVGSYLIQQRLQGKKRFPLVLMLEPLFRCNLACTGCGKIQHPKDILKQNLSPDDCFAAVEECGVPVVSIPGGAVPRLQARPGVQLCSRPHTSRRTGLPPLDALPTVLREAGAPGLVRGVECSTQPASHPPALIRRPAQWGPLRRSRPG